MRRRAVWATKLVKGCESVQATQNAQQHVPEPRRPNLFPNYSKCDIIFSPAIRPGVTPWRYAIVTREAANREAFSIEVGVGVVGAEACAGIVLSHWDPKFEVACQSIGAGQWLPVWASSKMRRASTRLSLTHTQAVKLKFPAN